MAAIACALLVSSCGGSAERKPSARITTASLAVFRAQMLVSLKRGELTWRHVFCVRTDHSFRGVPVVRCNVDFGDPHVEAYCAVLRGGRLLTNFQDRAIPCGHDDAGKPYTITAYP